MDNLMKIMLDMQIDEDIKKFIESNSNDQGIDASKLYIGKCVYIPKTVPILEADSEATIKDNMEFNAKNPFRILIDATLKTPHNRFFIDIINKQSLGVVNGWTGIGVPNRGFCVNEVEVLSIKIGKSRISLEELNAFIEEYNLSQRDEYPKL